MILKYNWGISQGSFDIIKNNLSSGTFFYPWIVIYLSHCFHCDVSLTTTSKLSNGAIKIKYVLFYSCPYRKESGMATFILHHKYISFGMIQ